VGAGSQRTYGRQPSTLSTSRWVGASAADRNRPSQSPGGERRPRISDDSCAAVTVGIFTLLTLLVAGMRELGALLAFSLGAFVVRDRLPGISRVVRARGTGNMVSPPRSQCCSCCRAIAAATAASTSYTSHRAALRRLRRNGVQDRNRSHASSRRIGRAERQRRSPLYVHPSRHLAIQRAQSPR